MVLAPRLAPAGESGSTGMTGLPITMSKFLTATILLLTAGPAFGQALGREATPADRAEGKRPQEKPVEPPVLPEDPSAAPPAVEEGGSPWIDFEWLEFEPRVGLAIFTGDFKIDPTAHFSLLLRAPMPWLSPGSDSAGDYFGIWGELTVLPSVERDLNPPPDDNSGTVFFFNLGLDYTFLRNQSLVLMGQLGVQYALWGGIADMSDGLGGVVGLDAGFYLGSGLSATLGTQAVRAEEDQILLVSLGLLVEF